MVEVKFLQKINGEWMETIHSSIFEIHSASGVTIRHAITNALQADIPFAVISGWRAVSKNFIICPVPKYAESVNIAFKFLSQNEFETVLDHVKSIGVHIQLQTECEDSKDIYNLNLPSVATDATQQYILKLLFDNNFPCFVNDIGEFLKQITDKIKVDTADDNDKGMHVHEEKAFRKT